MALRRGKKDSTMILIQDHPLPDYATQNSWKMKSNMKVILMVSRIKGKMIDQNRNHCHLNKAQKPLKMRILTIKVMKKTTQLNLIGRNIINKRLLVHHLKNLLRTIQKVMIKEIQIIKKEAS